MRAHGMKSELKFSVWLVFPLLLILASAAGLRAGYLAICTKNGEMDAAIRVQGDGPLARDHKGSQATEKDNLTTNIKEYRWFGCWAPLADDEEITAHVAPGFYWLFGTIAEHCDGPDRIWRWLNVALGSLTAGCYFFFARRAFHSTLVATLTGLLAACYPFWIFNTAELTDGVLATFLLSVCLMLGARGCQTGGILTGLLFGLSLACLVLVRAAMLPFAMIALLWYLWECRRYSFGWFAGFLALIGLANGLVLWGLRNYQDFEQPIPIADSTYLHLWMGNNPNATGSTMDEADLRSSLEKDRLQKLLHEKNQAKRYQQLAPDVLNEAMNHPVETMSRRLKAFEIFMLGEYWSRQGQLCVVQEGSATVASPPSWLSDNLEVILHGTLLGVFVLSLLGWRWSHAWRSQGHIAAIAFVWVPLPYILSHAEPLLGPRLPFDGVLLCYTAYALMSVIPGLIHAPMEEVSANVDASR
jgi:hypothetical protein